MNVSSWQDSPVPTLAEIRETRERLGALVRETPTWEWRGGRAERVFGKETQILLKLELFQYAGSFKPRGALTNMIHAGEHALRNGVTTVSAGNHAMATSYAAAALGTYAKVVMPESANPTRIARCREFGAEVVLVKDVHLAFETSKRIEAEEKRFFVHPFDGPHTALGTATLGLELCTQIEGLDAVVIPIGGGGLCAGVSAAVKLMNPQCKVFGVEPVGADSMHRSFSSGAPESIEKVETIADSLGAPYAGTYSYKLCAEYVDDLVLVDDPALCRAMAILFADMKLAVEPAGAAATAALFGPLRERLRGKRVALIICGTNIDPESFTRYVTQGFEGLASQDG